MKGIRKYWSKQPSIKQISVVFILLSIAQIVFLAGMSNTHPMDIIGGEIVGFFNIVMGQATSNIAAALNGYEEAVNQTIIDEKFLNQMERFEEVRGQMELSTEQELRKQMRTYTSYRPQIWCMAVGTENGKIFSPNRFQIDSLYQKSPELYGRYFS